MGNVTSLLNPGASSSASTDYETVTTVESGCAAGVPYTRVTRTPFVNGVAGVSAVTYVNSANAGTGVMPAGFTLGDCPVAVIAAAAKQFTTTVQDVAAGATLNIAAGANLVAWVLRNRNSTTGTYKIGAAGAVLPFDVGESISSGGVDEDGGTLTEDITVVAGNGIIRVTTFRRV